ncbi:MAG: methyltransferase domain-containing protein [Proteobacteria bacterium]|nr:methyltransferase domain-containing protein [Pseudomonadota bacterium]MBU1647896.1 methyltransferase domain-containing protein [Pseudomonadota bacterium]
MKKHLVSRLICPTCLPREHGLQLDIGSDEGEDIIAGTLTCLHCDSRFPIRQGIAFLDSGRQDERQTNRYEQEEVVSSYLWSHYGDLLADEQATYAYQQWAGLMEPHGGMALDLGGAVGRFTFEMSSKCDLAVGVDKSLAFVKTARRFMQEGELRFTLKDEGLLGREVVIRRPAQWQPERVEFIVADAQRLPFAAHTARSVASLNLVDKLPFPNNHLQEINRVAATSGSQLLLSDPFSWSTEAAEIDQWLGGKEDGPFAGKGLDNILAILRHGQEGLSPGWQVTKRDHVWWKIRTHSNHYELIRSCFIKAAR